MVLLSLASCKTDSQVRVVASFATEKDVYALNEAVVFHNTTKVENSIIAICKWEWGAGKVSYDFEPSGIVFTEEGEFPVKLTVTSNDGFVKDSFTATVRVEDHNIHPVADFRWTLDPDTWSEPETIKSGQKVYFMDLSSDEDGSIQEWSWSFGSSRSTEQNPSHEFAEFGDVPVTLTVTDNGKATGSVTKTLHIEKGDYFLILDWYRRYENTDGAFTRFTSPSLSPDGQSIYVTSSGAHLVSFSPDGDQKWSFDTGAHGAEYINNCGDKFCPVVTPSVGADGTVYFAAGYDEPRTEDTGQQGIFAINPDGTEKWYQSDGPKTNFCFFAPVVIDNYVATNQRYGGKAADGYISNDQGCVILNKSNGTRKQNIYSTSGSYGGMSVYTDSSGDTFFVNSSGNATHPGGCSIGFPAGEGKWNLVNGSTSTADEALWPGYGNLNSGCQSAVSADGKLYLLYPNNGSPLLYCYSIAELTPSRTQAPVPIFRITVPGFIDRDERGSETKATVNVGNGVVLSSGGVAYVTTNTVISAVDSEGNVLWEHEAEGRIHCVAAVDATGYIYYTDSETGRLCQLLPSNGQIASSVNLDAGLYSSPTIAEDGSIYVNGVREGYPTLFKVHSNAMAGPADNWSQLACNAQKTGRMKAK